MSYCIYSLIRRTIFYEKICLFHENLLKTRGVSYNRVFLRKEIELFQISLIINAVSFSIYGPSILTVWPGAECSSKRCNLCLKEKLLIICRPELSTLNKRNELVSSCRHRNKTLLRNN